jgi:sugar lactone lactonase YvrE
MGFPADHKGFYYTDSSAGEIYIFDYQIEESTLKERWLFASIPESEALPDGTHGRSGRTGLVGSLGRSWIVRFLPNGDVDVELNFPVRKISSLTFGGDDLQDFYVTT